MTGFEDERLRILERVSAGELTPQQGQLEIAMLKVGAQEQAAAVAAEDAGPGPGGAMPGGAAPRGAHPELLALFMLLPFMVMGGVVVVGMTFFLALPAYLVMSGWNAFVVPALPGTAALGFFQTLGAMVLASLLWTALSWRRRVRVFMRAGSPFREQ